MTNFIFQSGGNLTEVEIVVEIFCLKTVALFCIRKNRFSHDGAHMKVGM